MDTCKATTYLYFLTASPLRVLSHVRGADEQEYPKYIEYRCLLLSIGEQASVVGGMDASVMSDIIFVPFAVNAEYRWQMGFCGSRFLVGTQQGRICTRLFFT